MGLKLGSLDQYKDFDELWNAFEAQVLFILDHAAANGEIDEAWQPTRPTSFAACFLTDCLKKGKGLLAVRAVQGRDFETRGFDIASSARPM